MSYNKAFGSGFSVASAAPESALMTPAEVAAMFRVSPKTVARWSRSGRLTAMRTVGGHRRFRADEVAALRNQLDPREFSGARAANQ